MNSMPSKIRMDEVGRECSTNEGTKNANRILVVNPEGKRSLGRPSRR
jgi:hypothetical protein